MSVNNFIVFNEEARPELQIPNRDLSLYEQSIQAFYRQAWVDENEWLPSVLDHRAKLFHYVKQEGKCCFCSTNMLAPLQQPDNKSKLATIEHVKPKSFGGENHRENYKISCHSCNNFRGTVDYDYFQKCVNLIKDKSNMLKVYRSIRSHIRNDKEKGIDRELEYYFREYKGNK